MDLTILTNYHGLFLGIKNYRKEFYRENYAKNLSSTWIHYKTYFNIH